MSGELILTVHHAVQIARKWIRSPRNVMDPRELPEKLLVKLDGDYRIQSEDGMDVVCVDAVTGQVMYPNMDIRYHPR
jgi:hypothetical protein